MIPTIQNLESRRLLSATLASGVLTITGTAKKDEISVSLSSDGTTYTVKEKTAKNRFKKAKTTTTTFTASEVTSLVIDAGAGNDSVTLRGTRKTPFALAALITGGAGNDKLVGGAGNDTIKRRRRRRRPLRQRRHRPPQRRRRRGPSSRRRRASTRSTAATMTTCSSARATTRSTSSTAGPTAARPARPTATRRSPTPMRR